MLETKYINLMICTKFSLTYGDLKTFKITSFFTFEFLFVAKSSSIKTWLLTTPLGLQKLCHGDELVILYYNTPFLPTLSHYFAKESTSKVLRSN
jgi:hypothetical protein